MHAIINSDSSSDDAANFTSRWAIGFVPVPLQA
jgi:hypothetical protein